MKFEKFKPTSNTYEIFSKFEVHVLRKNQFFDKSKMYKLNQAFKINFIELLINHRNLS